VWRRQAIEESGGWDDRTTAEDMDLALRAALLGWEFVYVGAVKVTTVIKQATSIAGPSLITSLRFN
jgi:cellulose synthase/poly-beta-1,6-N-acetylglucosamine synthase-like glycosyltransferase